VLGEILTATVTPFDSSGAVDYDRYGELCTYLVDNGSDGVVVSARQARRRRSQMTNGWGCFELRSMRSADRATVVAGTGTYSTAHSVHLTEEAHEAGAHGFLVVTPYYNKPPPRGIVAHSMPSQPASDRPVIVYNIPSRVVINIEPKTMAQLAEIPNVTSVKQANADLGQAKRIVELDLDLYAGDDNLVHPFLELGGKAGSACIRTSSALGWQRWCAASVTATRRAQCGIDEELGPAYELLAVTTGPIQIKAALNLLGRDVGGHRLPLVRSERRGTGADPRLPRAARRSRARAG